MLVKIKKLLVKSQIGRILLKMYHYLIAIPVAKFYAIKYHLSRNKLNSIKFFNDEEVFRLLKENKYSFTRYGDGEISWIFKDSKGYFGQENSEELSDRLYKILQTKDKNIIIGIPNFFGTMEGYSSKRKKSRDSHLGKYKKRWEKLLDLDKIYGDSLLTRVYNGRDIEYSMYLFKSWRQIWEKKDVIIVEGDKTRFGVGNDLLKNAKTIRRIIAPATNAFKTYNQIYESSIRYGNEDVLFLISLGPTATILSYDLNESGFQSIDIGHLDIEYEWYLRNAKSKIPIPGKYVNEAGGYSVEELPKKIMEQYQNEIIEVIN